VDFIKRWQADAHMSKGLFENALDLISRMKMREKHPIIYFVIYRPVRAFWR
jgi:hypothetical protein